MGNIGSHVDLTSWRRRHQANSGLQRHSVVFRAIKRAHQGPGTSGLLVRRGFRNSYQVGDGCPHCAGYYNIRHGNRQIKWLTPAILQNVFTRDGRRTSRDSGAGRTGRSPQQPSLRYRISPTIPGRHLARRSSRYDHECHKWAKPIRHHIQPVFDLEIGLPRGL
jgi:hypothetical protein